MADRKISDLTALTTPAAGDYLPIVDISEAAAASKNKRITVEELMRGAPDGTAGAPGFAFESDPNSGIYSPGADQVAISTGGTERLRITSAGLVGIGTTSVGDLLHLRKGSSFAIQLDDTSNNHYIAAITSAGNYGNGSTVGQLYLRGASGIGFTGDGGTSTGMVLDSSSRLGIGTTTPTDTNGYGTAVDIRGSSTGNGGVIYLRNSDATVTGQLAVYGDGRMDFGTTTNHPLKFFTFNSERARIDSSGRLGIGTSSPSYALDVSGQIRAAANNTLAQLRLERTGSSTGHSWLGAQSDALLAVLDSSFAEKMRLDSSGRLLVGTSSSLDVNAGLQIAVNSSFSDFYPLQVFHFDSTDDTQGPTTIYTRSKSDTIGTVSAVNVNDGLGTILFRGAGTSTYVNGALIKAEVDTGTVSNTSLPGRLVFSTTADGASSPTERLRIDSNGYLTALGIYNNTTAVAANVHVSSAGGELFRSTSSIKYKTDVETIQDSYSEALLNCRPVWYRSTCEGDNANWGWWGFIAEEVAEIDPRLVHWKTTEVTYDEKGAAIQTPCDPEPESVQYDRFVPHLLNLVKRQQQAIETLEAKVAALESA